MIYSTKSTGRLKRRRTRAVGEMPKHLSKELRKMSNKDVALLKYMASISLLNDFGINICERL